jgi:hypothetical protein
MAPISRKSRHSRELARRRLSSGIAHRNTACSCSDSCPASRIWGPLTNASPPRERGRRVRASPREGRYCGPANRRLSAAIAGRLAAHRTHRTARLRSIAGASVYLYSWRSRPIVPEPRTRQPRTLEPRTLEPSTFGSRTADPGSRSMTVLNPGLVTPFKTPDASAIRIVACLSPDRWIGIRIVWRTRSSETAATPLPSRRRCLVPSYGSTTRDHRDCWRGSRGIHRRSAGSGQFDTSVSGRNPCCDSRSAALVRARMLLLTAGLMCRRSSAAVLRTW